MSSATANENRHLDELPYFLEWGGGSWCKLARYGIRDCIGVDAFAGKDVLEIGCRFGRMSCFFALLGAHAIGTDLREKTLIEARKEADKHGVSDRVTFMQASLSLDEIDDDSIDIIFTKSVLVVAQDLPGYLSIINRKLRSGGQVLFLENGRGNVVVQLARYIRHSNWAHNKGHFFTSRDIPHFQQVFDIQSIRRTRFRPVWMIHGKKKTD